MEDYPRDLAEFEARLSAEAACREYLVRLRWPDGFRCSRCGRTEGLARAWAAAAVCGLLNLARSLSVKATRVLDADGSRRSISSAAS
jgi:transposase-like zinc ribbon protein